MGRGSFNHVVLIRPRSFCCCLLVGPLLCGRYKNFLYLLIAWGSNSWLRMFAKVGYSVILILCLSVGAIANVMNYAVVPAVWGAHRNANAHVF